MAMLARCISSVDRLIKRGSLAPARADKGKLAKAAITANLSDFKNIFTPQKIKANQPLLIAKYIALLCPKKI